MASRVPIQIVPSPRLMRTIGGTALNEPESVAELIANSIDARCESKPVRIDVNLERKSIVVVDDAKGMDLATLENALRLGFDMDVHAGSKRNRMGTYGLGMKSAAANLGDRWSIVTRPVGVQPPVELSVQLDLLDFERRALTSDSWALHVDVKPPNHDGVLGDRASGTAIVIEKLRTRNLLPGPYLEFLGRAFAPYVTEQRDQIFVNGTPASTVQPNTVEGSRFEFRTTISEEHGWEAHGWVALDVQTHNKGDYGLHLYRKGQLVELWNKSFFSAHLMTSRIVGEAHLDHVPVNFNKKGFEQSSEEWESTVPPMREVLKPAVEASRTMSRGRHDEGKEHRAISKMRQVLGLDQAGVVEDELPGHDAEDASKDGGVASEQDRPRPKGFSVHASRDRIELARGTVRIACSIDDLGSETIPWDYLYDPTAFELLVILNPVSAAFEKTADVEFLSCIAIADCLTRVLTEREGIDATKSRRVRDQWLHEALVGGYSPTQSLPHKEELGAGAS